MQLRCANLSNFPSEGGGKREKEEGRGLDLLFGVDEEGKRKRRDGGNPDPGIGALIFFTTKST